jgi:hypothetical protein
MGSKRIRLKDKKRKQKRKRFNVWELSTQT